MKSEEVIKNILDGKQVLYTKLSKSGKTGYWTDVKTSLTLDEIIESRILNDFEETIKLKFKLADNDCEFDDFLSDFNFLFGNKYRNYNEEENYAVWKYAKTLTLDTFSKDDKTYFYTDFNVFSQYSVTKNMINDFTEKFLGSTEFKEIFTSAGNKSLAWFTKVNDVSSTFEFIEDRNAMMFEVFIFSLFKYGKLA